MTFNGIIYPEQISVLSEVLARHCDAANIRSGTPEYEAEGARIVALYENGARSLYALLAGLNEPENTASLLSEKPFAEPAQSSKLIRS